MQPSYEKVIKAQRLSEQGMAETRKRQFDERTEAERNRPEREALAERERAVASLERANEELPRAERFAKEMRTYLDQNKEMLGGSSLDAAYQTLQQAENGLTSLQISKRDLEKRLRALGVTVPEAPAMPPERAQSERGARFEVVDDPATVKKLESAADALPEATMRQREQAEIAQDLEREMQTIADDELSHLAVNSFARRTLDKGDWDEVSERDIDKAFEDQFGPSLDSAERTRLALKDLQENVRNEIREMRVSPGDATAREQQQVLQERASRIQEMLGEMNKIMKQSGEIDPQTRQLMAEARRVQEQIDQAQAQGKLEQGTYDRLHKKINERTGV